MAYCTNADLLIEPGFPISGGETTKTKFVNLAAMEIDAILGERYVVPVPLATLPQHEKDLLKIINIKRASGSLILSQANAGEDTALHQYGLWLINEAQMQLMAIANGDIDLQSPRVDQGGEPTEGGLPTDDDPDAYAPGGTHWDAISPIDAFEANFMGPYNVPVIVPWVPGPGDE